MERLIKGSLELNQMFGALARTASGLRRDFGEVESLQQSLKGARDFVQKAAARIEESIVSDLRLVRPNAGLLTPNVSADGDGRDEFVLAFSGAANFVRGNPHFAISLALRSMGETKIALIYSPIDERLYYAESRAGAFVFSAYHSTKIRVSEKKDESDRMIGIDSVATAEYLRAGRSGSVRLSGCPALDLAWVAAGKFDAFVSESLDYAEVCAGELLIGESGGKIWEDSGYLFAANGAGSAGL
jgi:myo-inositol-1(or 4)-monophosphatase